MCRGNRPKKFVKAYFFSGFTNNNSYLVVLFAILILFVKYKLRSFRGKALAPILSKKKFKVIFKITKPLSEH
jgi:hypothetical protein